MRATPLHLALLAGWAMAGAASAQEQPQQGGPIIVGVRHDSWSDFELERVTAALEARIEKRLDRRTNADGTELTDRETLLRETLDLDTAFSLGHRNLLDFTALAQFGLEDRWDKSDTLGIDSHQTDSVILYDIRALILGNGPIPTTVYSRREQNLVDRLFGGTLESTIEETGVSASLVSERAPTTLTYFHRTIDLDDHLDVSDSNTTQDSFTLQSGIRLTDRQRLDISYTFDHIDEEQPGIFSDSYDRHDGNIVHTLDFGSEGRLNELRSSLRFYSQGGAFQQEEVRWDELLILRHTDRLETRFSTLVDQRSDGAQDQRLYQADASIRHRLFESLVSSAHVGASRLDIADEAISDRVFADVLFDYTKRIPLGTLEASVGGAYETQHNGARGSTLSVFGEQYVFNDPFPIVIPRRNIVPGSIVVTPLSGFPPYIQGADYIVAIFPDRAELTIPPGSMIVDGQAVLVSYDIGPEPESTIDTYGATFSFRYSITESFLQGVSVYGNYHTVDHTLDAADPSLFILDDTRDLLLGVQYNRFHLDAKYEQEWHDSTVNPYDLQRIQVLYQRPLGRESAVGLEATHESIDYTAARNHVDFDRISARWDQRVNEYLNFNVRLEYRDQNDDIGGDSEGFDQILGFNWHRAQTTIYGSFRNSYLNGEFTDTLSQEFQFGIRRAF